MTTFLIFHKNLPNEWLMIKVTHYVDPTLKTMIFFTVKVWYSFFFSFRILKSMVLFIVLQVCLSYLTIKPSFIYLFIYLYLFHILSVNTFFGQLVSEVLYIKLSFGGFQLAQLVKSLMVV